MVGITLGPLSGLLWPHLQHRQVVLLEPLAQGDAFGHHLDAHVPLRGVQYAYSQCKSEGGVTALMGTGKHSTPRSSAGPGTAGVPA